MKQPISVWTCIAFLLVGLKATEIPIVGTYLFIAFAYLAVASAGFHWTREHIWQKADESSMYFTFWAIISSFLVAWYPENAEWILFACMTAPILMTVFHPFINTFPGVGILFWVSWTLFLASHLWWESLVVLTVFGLYYLIRQIGDGRRENASSKYSYEDPNESEDPLHGFSHVIASIGFWLMLFAF